MLQNDIILNKVDIDDHAIDPLKPTESPAPCTEINDQFVCFSSTSVPAIRNGFMFGAILTPFPSSSSVASPSQLGPPLRDLLENKIPNLPKPPIVHSECSPLICSYCEAYANHFCEVSDKTWRCVFCAKINSSDVVISDQTLSLSHPIVEFLSPDQSSFGLLQREIRPSIIFLIDLNITQSEMEILTDHISIALDTLHPDSRVGIITFSNTISLYNLTSDNFVQAELLPGETSLLRSQADDLILRVSQFLVPLKFSRENINQILVYLRHVGWLKRVNLRTGRQSGKSAMEMRRAFGPAIDLAFLILSQREPIRSYQESNTPNFNPGGKIIGFLTGVPNRGPGQMSEDNSASSRGISINAAAAAAAAATQHSLDDYQSQKAKLFYSHLGKDMLQHNICFDLFCIGLRSFGLPILKKLAKESGGNFVLQKGFNDVQLRPNLVLSCGQRSVGRRGLLSVFSSAPFSLNHLIGSVKSEHQVSNFAYLQNLQPGSAVSLYFDVTEDCALDHVYFQFVIDFVSSNTNQRVSRVITKQIPVINEISSARYLTTINPHIFSVLLAKQILLTSAKKSLWEATEMLDASIKKLIKSFKKELPFTLTPVPYLLFLLRRGNLLGTLPQHRDDLEYLRFLFLKADLQTCLRLLDPPFIAVRLIESPSKSKEQQESPFDLSQVEMELFPLEDLALQSNVILLLDHHTDLFVWLGEDVAHSEPHLRLADHLLEMALHHCQSRFPQPYSMKFSEGSSMSRWLLSRLPPSHKDSPEEQLFSFPQLAKMPPEARLQLSSKFLHTDDLSFRQYMRQLLR